MACPVWITQRLLEAESLLAQAAVLDGVPGPGAGIAGAVTGMILRQVLWHGIEDWGISSKIRRLTQVFSGRTP